MGLGLPLDNRDDLFAHGDMVYEAAMSREPEHPSCSEDRGVAVLARKVGCPLSCIRLAEARRPSVDGSHAAALA